METLELNNSFIKNNCSDSVYNKNLKTFRDEDPQCLKRFQILDNKRNNENDTHKPIRRINRRSFLQRPNIDKPLHENPILNNLQSVKENPFVREDLNLKNKVDLLKVDEKFNKQIIHDPQLYKRSEIMDDFPDNCIPRAKSLAWTFADEGLNKIIDLESNATTKPGESSHLLKKPEKIKLDYFSMKNKPILANFSQEFLQSFTGKSSILSSNEISGIHQKEMLKRNTERLDMKFIDNFDSTGHKIDTKSIQPKKKIDKGLSKNNFKVPETRKPSFRSKSCTPVSESLMNLNTKLLSNSFSNADEKRYKSTKISLDLKPASEKLNDKMNAMTYNVNKQKSNETSYEIQTQRISNKKKNFQIFDKQMKNNIDNDILRYRGDSIINAERNKSNISNSSLLIFQTQNNEFLLDNLPKDIKIDNVKKPKTNEDFGEIDTRKEFLSKSCELNIEDEVLLRGDDLKIDTELDMFPVAIIPTESYPIIYHQTVALQSLVKIEKSKFLLEFHKHIISNETKEINLSFEEEYNKEIEKHRNLAITKGFPVKEPEKEKKRIYTSILEEIYKYFIEDNVNLLNSKEKKPKLKIKLKKETKSINKKLPKIIENNLYLEITFELLNEVIEQSCTVVESNSKQPKTSKLSNKWMDDISTLKFSESDFNNLLNYDQNSEYTFKSLNFKDARNISESTDYTNSHIRSNSKNQLKIPNSKFFDPESMTDETFMSGSFKKTILMYEAKYRKLAEEKDKLLKENLELSEHNKGLQRRHGVLLNEFKQERREIAFIKNQITVMISRLQSIPDKLNQLEAENENLKSEVSDLERTLVQRDQLFISERQINTSLSEEIVKLEAETVNKDLMKNVCEEFENLNDEYEMLKNTLEETEDKLFEIVQDRDNLIKHAKIMEEHLYKLKGENNYYQMLTTSGIMPDNLNNRFSDIREKPNYLQNNPVASNPVDKYECENENKNPNCNSKGHRDQNNCRHLRSRPYSHHSNYSYSSTTSSYSDSSSGSDRKYRKRKKKSHRHKHKESHSHKHSHRSKSKKRSHNRHGDSDIKLEVANQNQNANVPMASVDTIEMPKSREELKELEKLYDKLQFKKSKLEGDLSHVPLNKGLSNSLNMNNLREQETLEEDLDQCDKKLATLRKILKQCKVFKFLP